MDAPKVVLGYWAARGLAERIRHLLEYLAITYTQEKFQAADGRNKWFNDIKPKLLEKNPALTLPYLMDGDKLITQVEGICVYLCFKANRGDLLGRNPEQQVAIATAHGLFKDFYPNYVKLVYGKYDESHSFQQALEDSHEQWKTFFKKLDGLLGDRKFMAGELTWLDFGIADFFQTLYLLNSNYFKEYPRLLQYQKRVWALPELKDYFESRYIERPCNNYTAEWK